MCLDLFLLEFILYGTLCTSCTWVTISLRMLGKFLTIIFSNIFSGPFFFSSSYENSINSNVGAFNVVPEVYETVLNSFFFILLLSNYFHHSIFQFTYLFFCLSYSATDSFYSKYALNLFSGFSTATAVSRPDACRVLSLRFLLPCQSPHRPFTECSWRVLKTCMTPCH